MSSVQGTESRRRIARILAGTPHFLNDLTWDGEVWGEYIRAPEAGVRVGSRAFPSEEPTGLLRIFDAETVPRKPYCSALAPVAPDYAGVDDDSILADVSKFAGDSMLFIVSETRESLAEALTTLAVTWEPGEVTETGRTLGVVTAEAGQLRDDAAANSDHIAIDTQPIQHICLETHGCAAVPSPADGTLTIHSNTQDPAEVRRIVGEVLDIDPALIRVVKTPEGGGFGNKLDIYAEIMVGYAASVLGRPVRCGFSRTSEFLGTRHRHPAELRSWVDLSSATLTGIRLTGSIDSGAVLSHSPFVARELAMFPAVAYPRVPFRSEVRIVGSPKPPSGAYRGYGTPQAAIAIEQAIDEAARREHIDPLELRLDTFTAAADSCQDAISCLTAGRDIWSALQRKHDERWRGAGLAFSGMKNRTARNQPGDIVRLDLRENGAVRFAHGTVDSGTGSTSGLLQLLLAHTNLDPSDIEVAEGDTSLDLTGLGSHSQRSLSVCVPAVQEAGKRFIGEILKAAAEFTHTPADELSMAGQWIVHRNTRTPVMSLEALATRLAGQGKAITVSSDARPAKAIPSYCLAMATVDICEDTFTPALDELHLYVACGHIVNEPLARGQLLGACAQAIGMALVEDAGRASAFGGTQQTRAAPDIFLHGLPSVYEIPRVEIHYVPPADSSGQQVVRGVGEMGIAAVTAAIANAIRDATGHRHARLPILPSDIFDSVRCGR